MKGKKKAAGVAADARTGQVLGLDALVERDSDAFIDWIGLCADEFGVEAIAADDLNTCKPVAERLGLKHQICMARTLRRAWNRLKRQRAGTGSRSGYGGLELLRIERLVRDDDDQTLRRLCVDLSNKWRALLCRRRRGDVPGTNNATERAIGRSKIRYKTVRGVQKRIGNVERVWSDAAGVERVGQLGIVGTGRGVK